MRARRSHSRPGLLIKIALQGSRGGGHPSQGKMPSVRSNWPISVRSIWPDSGGRGANRESPVSRIPAGAGLSTDTQIPVSTRHPRAPGCGGKCEHHRSFQSRGIPARPGVGLRRLILGRVGAFWCRGASGQTPTLALACLSRAGTGSVLSSPLPARGVIRINTPNLGSWPIGGIPPISAPPVAWAGRQACPSPATAAAPHTSGHALWWARSLGP